MSLGKLPAIKGLVSTSHAKRRFKSDLSVDMISPPLGDFRHTMHVGRGGDVFGDTSFLSNYGGSANNDGYPDSPTGSRTTRFLSRTLQHVRKPPMPRMRGGSRDFSSPPPPISPIIKNAISLPQLNMTNDGLMRSLLPTSTSSSDEPLCSYGHRSGFITLPRSSRLDQSFAETPELLSEDSRQSSLPENSDVSMTRSDSLSSFTVDLGPSLMSEVLELIDSSCCLITSRQEEEEEPSSVFEMDHNGPETNTLIRRPITADAGIEPKKFQQAASMLTRHFGGGRSEEERQRASSFRHTRTPYSFTEADEEIKV
ncbi:cdc42 effector protein 1b [Pimephales promelas]|uniref:cdc42 effector protein 1b n=1 Tax=Pimephales promelas TaxID=90988 RepID=UPI001955D479|nr:cdc42 effector protein 1b [Pimephales promelas]KAG1966983.1 cdc42 effector protein [Pimephales promelas]